MQQVVEALRALTEYIPFLGMVVTPKMKPDNDISPRIIARMLEAFIIGGVILFGTVRALTPEIDGLKADVKEIKNDVNQIRQDLYRPITE